MEAVLSVILPPKEIFLEKNLKEAIMRILLSCLLFIPFFAAHADHEQSNRPCLAPPEGVIWAVCDCETVSLEGRPFLIQTLGDGASLTEAVQEAKSACEYIVRQDLINLQGLSPGDAALQSLFHAGECYDQSDFCIE